MRISSLLAGAAAGAGFMYWLDPDAGRRRRARSRDKLAHGTRSLTSATDAAVRDLAHRSRGVVAEAASRLRSDGASDDVIVARVHAKLGQVCSHPGAVEVHCTYGRVWLSGHILEHELEQVLRAVERVRGVRELQHDLRAHATAENIPSLQGGRPRTGTRFELMQRNWAPGTRLVAGTAGLGILGSALRWRGALGAAGALAGAALATRALTNLELGRALGLSGDRGIDVAKTIHIHAPVEEVFAFWRALESFPRFMTHVKRVEKLGNDRYHWEVAGPAGIPLAWDAELTGVVPNQSIGWKSVEGSSVASSGFVRFDPDAGGTRVRVRMSYNPPGGALGHAVAKLLGADPKHQMDDDLLRLKSLLESGGTRKHHERVRKEDLVPSAP